MFGIGELHKKVNQLEIIAQMITEQNAINISRISSDINALIQEIAKLKLENNQLKQQLLKEKGRVVLTVCNSSLHQ